MSRGESHPGTGSTLEEPTPGLRFRRSHTLPPPSSIERKSPIAAAILQEATQRLLRERRGRGSERRRDGETCIWRSALSECYSTRHDRASVVRKHSIIGGRAKEAGRRGAAGSGRRISLRGNATGSSRSRSESPTRTRCRGRRARSASGRSARCRRHSPQPCRCRPRRSHR